jgi:solute carrier family 13 (sodium-dependent dicarboxylate transporter), member 2/3/5
MSTATILPKEQKGESEAAIRVRFGGALLGVMAAIALWYFHLPLEPKAQQSVAIATLLITFWITEILPHAITGLLGCWLFWSLGVVSPRVALGGFSSDAPWFLLGALFIGAMATESGLAKRLAYTMLSRVGASFPRILMAFILTGFVMTVMIPAGPPRVILLGTIVLGVVQTYGLERSSNVGKSLILAITFSASLFDKGIIGSTPSILARNLITEFGHTPVSWSQWFIAYANLFNIVITWWVLQRMFPAETNKLPGGMALIREERARLGRWTASEKKAAFWIVVGVSIWATDFIHHLNPAIVGVGVGLAATFPRVGVLTRDQTGKINFLIFLFMGSTVSSGGGLTGDRRGQGAGRRPFRLHRSDDQHGIPFHIGPILDGFRRPPGAGFGNCNGLDHHTCAHGVCIEQWPQPARYRNALDIRSGRSTLHIPITGSDRGLLVRLLQCKRRVQVGRVLSHSREPGAFNSGSLLLAANWYRIDCCSSAFDSPSVVEQLQASEGDLARLRL